MSYSAAKGGKLVLKGESSERKHKKSKKRKSEETHLDARLEDELNHAGGWSIEKSEQITGTIFIEFTEFMYMHALDNGLFVLGKHFKFLFSIKLMNFSKFECLFLIYM
jgi:hypothetical protein